MMKTATLIILTLALCGCLRQIPHQQIDKAVRECIAAGGAPDFVRDGSNNHAPVAAVVCYGGKQQ